MLSDSVIVQANELGKTYTLFHSPVQRLRKAVFGSAAGGREFVALKEVSFELRRGEVLGLVGRNGAGKSTLLQLVCGTVSPSRGKVHITGRVAALLELGAGFNPDFSGRENIFLNGTVLGLSRQEIETRFDAIVAFSGIGEFIDQPVKTYSSGMLVRLAFSIATSVEPDVLVVDEALSVGDGAFARKSFDRIMALRDRGTTILFCSHSLFQVESICTRAIWLERGVVQMDGAPADVVSAYQGFLDQLDSAQPTGAPAPVPRPQGHARLLTIQLGNDAVHGQARVVHSRVDDLLVRASFASDPSLPAPALAVTLHTEDARIVSSAGSWNDGVVAERDTNGLGNLSLRFPRIALLKGRYYVSVHLFCERGLLIYDVADRVAWLKVEQTDIEQGVVSLPHVWETSAGRGGTSDVALTDTSNGLDREDLTASVGKQLLEDIAGCAKKLQLDGCVPSEQLSRWARVQSWQAVARRFGFDVETSTGEWVKRRDTRWKLGWVDRSQQSQWARLFEIAFGYTMPTTQWDWKYANSDILGIGAYANGEMVAFYGGMPRPILYFGQPATAVQIGDVMVHPSERGVMTKKGPFQMAAATYLELCIGNEKPYLLGFGFPADKAMKLAEKLGLYAAVDQMSEIQWPVPSAFPNLRVSARGVQSTDADAVNQLWGEMAAAFKDSILGVRDWAYLNHRYMKHPTVSYVLMLLRDRWRKKPLGVVVMRDREQQGLEVMDVIGPPEHFMLMVDVARRYAARLGRTKVFTWVTRSQAPRLMGPLGRAEHLNVFVPTNIWSAGPAVEAVRGHWWLTGGDTDFR